VIADEPTSALDVTVQRRILDLIDDLRREHGTAVLLVTHDLGVAAERAERIVVMQHGRIVEHGPTAALLDAPAEAYTRRLVADAPGLAEQPFRHPTPPIYLRDAGVAAAENPFALVATGLTKTYSLGRGREPFRAVDEVSFRVLRGTTHAIVGESGSGKTTLGLAILRLISSQGLITFLGKPINGLNFKAMRPIRRDMQVVFQDPYGSLSPRMSLSDIIEEGLWVHFPNLSNEEREQKVMRALREVGLDPATRFRYPHEFSGGQRQRIAVARAIVLEPTFIVLDEPTSALDMLIQAQIVDLLRDLQKRLNLTYLFISHDLRVVAALASRLIVMRHGKVVEEGPAKELFARPQSDYTRALFAAAFNLDTASEGVVAQ
jgi:ABC-type microcin C transport system duplicated ATPase subunit YejF